MSKITYGLLGRKLGHSMSPQIQARFGIKQYQLVEIEPDHLADFMKARQFDGLNVTMPYKRDVIPFLDELDPVAVATGSVNCILRQGERLIGYNTDCFGFKYLLRQSGIRVYQKRCTVIGTGGVSSSIEKILYDDGAKSVRFLSHALNTPEKRRAFSETEILVNATPVGLFPHSDDSPVPLSDFPFLDAVVDVVANPYRTNLIQEAESKAIPCAGGLIMLVGQAGKTAEIFSGRTISESRIADTLDVVSKEMLNIILIGMPGSGKSTVGKKLAEMLGRPFVDTDSDIEETAGKSIPDIFKERGEEEFRNMETEALKKLTARTGQVISTGGGCVVRKENRRLLRQNGYCVYLTAPLNELDVVNRPLSSDKYALLRLFEQRNNIYLSLADTTLQRRKTPDETAKELRDLFLKTRFASDFS